jgi:hypothetical protein
MKKHDGLLTNILEDKTYLTYWSIFYYNTFGCDVVSWYLYWANCFLLLQSPYLSYPANPPAYYPQSGNLPPGNVSVSFLTFFLSFGWWNVIFFRRLFVIGSLDAVSRKSVLCALGDRPRRPKSDSRGSKSCRTSLGVMPFSFLSIAPWVRFCSDSRERTVVDVASS